MGRVRSGKGTSQEGPGLRLSRCLCEQLGPRFRQGGRVGLWGAGSPGPLALERGQCVGQMETPPSPRLSSAGHRCTGRGRGGWGLGPFPPTRARANPSPHRAGEQWGSVRRLGL